LTANRQAMIHPELVRIAHHYNRSASQIIFRFALDIGMVVLTGTTNADHMRADLEVVDFQLESEEVKRIEGLVG
jgi:diketogulonate reductase-like aldo/keto reductase